MISKPPLTNITLTILLLLCFLIIPSYGFSGCELCAQFGQCSTAFRNSPGQYCGDWYDYTASHNKPCCCPTDSTCKNSGTSCSCHVSSNYNPSHAPPSNYNPSYAPPYRPSSSSSSYSSYSSYSSSNGTALFGVVLFFTIFICCFCFIIKCIRSCCKASLSHEYNDPFVATNYTPNPPPLNPQYHNTPVTVMPVATASSYNTYGATAPSYSTGGNVTSALGGFAAGTVLGNLLSHSGDHNNGGGYDYSGGHNNGGGYGYSGGGYDIPGDSGDGGGGYDIPGDSGDGGWFGRGETADGGYDIPATDAGGYGFSAADDGGYDIAGDS
mmetsp:Transcript_17537/g.25401  ORF Transcript_17537/g.25401 Transcript_17537/m.25401 type:complete len:325 (-) Transcript_17537:88-1062(-)